MSNEDVETGRALIMDHLSDVKKVYHIVPKELGHGHYGVVRECIHRETKISYAMKSIRKKKVNKIDVLKREIDLLMEVDHPNIIKLIEAFEDDKYLHLVTELCTGGELFDRIIAKTQSAEGHYSEHDAAELIQSILEAIRYCHDVKHICHRDLKPENFLFQSRDEHSAIKIIDFGLSRHTDNVAHMKTKVGTPYYVAPEVLDKSYDKSCDMWSIGVISYILLCGYPPFYGDNDQQIFDAVSLAKYDYPSPEWDNVSAKAKDFIGSLLKKTPSHRLTAATALNHTWFKDVGLVDKNLLPKLETGSKKATDYKAYLGMNKLKKEALNHIANNLSSTEIRGMQEVFEKIDKNHDGSLTIDELQRGLVEGGFNTDVNTEIQRMIHSLGVSGENTLDWQAFQASMIERSATMKEEKIKLAFDYLDLSKDGSLTIQDLTAIFGSEKQAMEIMGDVDVNGDGIISYEEFHAMMQKDTSLLGVLMEEEE